MCREFHDDDLSQLMAIWRKAMEDSLSFLSPECLMHLEPYTRDCIKYSNTYIYPEVGEPRGFITLEGNQILNLYVSPQQQGMGIGPKLIDCAKSLRDALTLEVHEKNKRAIRFYKKHDFKEKGEPTLDDCNEQKKTMYWSR